jgi:hypothetical protein
MGQHSNKDIKRAWELQPDSIASSKGELCEVHSSIVKSKKTSLFLFTYSRLGQDDRPIKYMLFGFMG